MRRTPLDIGNKIDELRNKLEKSFIDVWSEGDSISLYLNNVTRTDIDPMRVKIEYGERENKHVLQIHKEKNAESSIILGLSEQWYGFDYKKLVRLNGRIDNVEVAGQEACVKIHLNDSNFTFYENGEEKVS